MGIHVAVWRWFTDVIQRLLFPVFCVRCGVEGDILCISCEKTAPLVPVQVCIFCSTASPNGRTCSACNRHALDGAIARGLYDDWFWRSLIIAWKFNGATITPLLSRYVDDAFSLLPQEYSVEKFAIVPVPLGKRRHRERGRNQSMDLAKVLASTHSVSRAVTRIRETARQSQLSRKDRIRNVHSAFWADPKLVQSGGIYLLLDDVVTTGATLNEVARALKAAGARLVWAVVLARSK